MGKFPNMVHHKRLEDHSFNLIKSLFPCWFTKEFVQSFKCDIFQLSKHHHAFYPICDKKRNFQFDFINVDVWGPILEFISKEEKCLLLLLMIVLMLNKHTLRKVNLRSIKSLLIFSIFSKINLEKHHKKYI